MTDREYKEHIQHTHNAYCRIVIRHASIDAARMLYAKWKREISLEYLSEEKFVPFSTADEYFSQPPINEDYPFTACGQIVLISDPALATALQADLDRAQEATVNAEKFMKIVRKYLAFEELTPTLLREMVEKIVVYECSYDGNGTRRQDIDIYYSFVGKIDLTEV